MQASGIDADRYVPAAPELAGLRDPVLWPATSHWCVRPGTPDPDRAGATLVPGCSKLNRPWVHTIYPPVAEAYFLAVDEASPAGAGTRPMQAAAAWRRSRWLGRSSPACAGWAATRGARGCGRGARRSRSRPATTRTSPPGWRSCRSCCSRAREAAAGPRSVEACFARRRYTAHRPWHTMGHCVPNLTP